MPGFFSPQTLEQIRAASDIVEVIGAVLPLKRAGANFTALCPFHREKTPSFSVNPQRQIFYCFGCHKGGNVFKFVQEYEHLDFPEAVRRLAERAHIPLEQTTTPGDSQVRFVKESLLHVHEEITQHWQRVLSQDAQGQLARDYLKKRGVQEEAIQLFRLGCAPDSWDDTVNWAKSKNLELALLEQGGLIIRKENTDRYYDRFRGRLIFPICDEQGRVVGFSGRILSGEAKTAKYVNSPETPIFTKGKVIYGLDKSKRALLETQYAVICEGQLDLIACFMAGVKNVIAPQGTALTVEHARILKRYVNEVVLCFDSDSAGQKATVRVLDELLAAGLAIRVATVPAPHDPDSFVKEAGPEALQQLIQRAEGFFDFYLNRLCQEHNITTDKGRLAIVHAMAEAVQKTGHPVLVDTYAQKTALRLSVALEAIRKEFSQSRRGPSSPAPLAEETVPEIDPPSRPTDLEVWLLKLFFLNEDHWAWMVAHWDPAWVQHERVRRILCQCLEDKAQENWRGVGTVLDTCPDSPSQQLIAEAVANTRAIPNPQQQLQDLLLRLRNQFLDRQAAALVQQAAQPGLTEEERLHLFQRKAELRQLKNQPL